VLIVLGGTALRLALSTLRTSFFPVYLVGLDVSPAVAGLVVGAGTLAGVFATPLTLRFVRRYGAARFLFLALLAGAGAMIVTPALSALPLLTAVGLVWGISIGITLPPLIALIAAHTAPAERGLGTAVRNTGNECSIMVSPILFGQVAQWTGVADAFVVLGGVVLAGSALGWLWARRLDERFG
jgi:CP family cyanate transporter-like MFS transporter